MYTTQVFLEPKSIDDYAIVVRSSPYCRQSFRKISKFSTQVLNMWPIPGRDK